jgi:hypothetical protein
VGIQELQVLRSLLLTVLTISYLSLVISFLRISRHIAQFLGSVLR